MKHSSILVTGGAGYIGSHVLLQLRARGERVVVLDDLSRGFRQAVLDAPFVLGQVGDRDTVLEVLEKHRVEYEGQYVYFCCSGCIDMFKADPAAAIAKMTPEDRDAIKKNTTCPITGEEIGASTERVEFEGREDVHLEPGDCLVHAARIPHRWSIEGDAPVRLFLVVLRDPA